MEAISSHSSREKETTSFTSPSSARARGRWKLLRRAILGNNDGDDDDELLQSASIHRFRGFQTIVSRTHPKFVGIGHCSDPADREYIRRLSTVRISRRRTSSGRRSFSSIMVTPTGVSHPTRSSTVTNVREADFQEDEDGNILPATDAAHCVAEEAYCDHDDSGDEDSPAHPSRRTTYRIRTAAEGVRCFLPRRSLLSEVKETYEKHDDVVVITLIAAGHAISTLLDLLASMERRGDTLQAVRRIETGLHNDGGGGGSGNGISGSTGHGIGASGTLAVSLSVGEDECSDEMDSDTTKSHTWMLETKEWRCVEYSIKLMMPSFSCSERKEALLNIRTREPIMETTTKEKLNKRMHLQDLVSHREEHGGIDGTGLIRVWDAETMLVHLLFCGVNDEEDTNANEVKNDNCFYNPLGLQSIMDLAVPFFPHIFHPPPPVLHKAASNDDAPMPSLQRQGTSSKEATFCDDGTSILRVIELGCGMAGLAGIALATLDRSTPLGLSLCTGSNGRPVRVQVLLTDGHVEAVRNNAVCCLLTESMYEQGTEGGHNGNKNTTNNGDINGDEEGQRLSSDQTATTRSFSVKSSDKHSLQHHHISNVRARVLRWDDGPSGASECAIVTRGGRQFFQLCLVSDCLHFEQYHGALLATIGRVLDYTTGNSSNTTQSNRSCSDAENNKGGMAILIQPTRGKSLHEFRELIWAVNRACGEGGGGGEDDGIGPLFEEDFVEKYNEDIWNQHKQFLVHDNKKQHYDPNIHYPVLLILKKLRPYDENRDTAFIKKAANKRDQKES